MCLGQSSALLRSDQPKCKTVVLCSAPNGDYSAASLQSVKDEVFINIFDEVVYETGVVSKRRSMSLPERVELFFTMEHTVLLRLIEIKGNQYTPGLRSTGWAPSRFPSAPSILSPG